MLQWPLLVQQNQLLVSLIFSAIDRSESMKACRGWGAQWPVELVMVLQKKNQDLWWGTRWHPDRTTRPDGCRRVLQEETTPSPGLTSLARTAAGGRGRQSSPTAPQGLRLLMTCCHQCAVILCPTVFFLTGSWEEALHHTAITAWHLNNAG